MLLEWQEVPLQECGINSKKQDMLDAWPRQGCAHATTTNNDRYILLNSSSRQDGQYQIQRVSFGNKTKNFKPNNQKKDSCELSVCT
ncbi:hypothetical protein TNCV_2876741 [Trichonephila clavipes]|uniref:Uncharacterized protein n=1 Tax=Trichonephila clavipes TaxID=2585209 RepID=A0A8X7BIX0_TRICX|nr:hypothetical protein TNCV_2876741 [Trichonephila clavipes]